MTATLSPTSTVSEGTSLPRSWGLVRHSMALTRRSLLKTRRNPGILLDSLFLPVVFLLLFTYLFGGAVGGSTREYLQYIFPGVVVMALVMVGMLSTGVSLNIDIKKGVFDRFRSLPIGRSAPLIGSVVSDMTRYVVALGTLFGLGYLLGFRVQTGLLETAAAAGLGIAFGFGLSWVSVLIGVLFREPVIVQTVGFLGIFPLAFGTSMVAPSETMPGWLQAWIDVNPVSHAVDATRGLLLGGPVADAATSTLLWAGAFVVVFAPLAVHAYRRQS